MMEQDKPAWKRLHFEESTIVDMHAHPSLKVSLFNRVLTKRYNATRLINPFSVRTDFPKLKSGGLDVLLSVVYPPEREIVDDCRPLGFLRYVIPKTWQKIFEQPYFDVANELLDEMEGAVESAGPSAQMARSVSELDAILSQGENRPIAVIHSLEGAHSLDKEPDNLDHFFNRGVAYLTIAHFYPNGVANPCHPYPEPFQIGDCFRPDVDISQGLGPLGVKVVEKMVELGILIDLTHCTPPARRQVYDIVLNQAPLMATHVGAYEINPDPYNLEDWEIKRIADTGGFVGVIFLNYWLMPHHRKNGLNYISRTLSHFVNVGGVEHAGVGSDFDGFTDPPDDLKDASELPKLTQRLLADGHSEGAIRKILGGSALRVLRQGWGKR